MSGIKTKVFFRSFYISSVICFCLAFGCYGIAKAYENTRAVGFGDYRKAADYSDGILRILDFEIELVKK